MELDNLFDKIDNSIRNQLPFVAYRQSNNKAIQSLFQEDDTLYYLNDFSQSGFVFAPFDAREKTILFPLEKCKSYSFEDLGIIKENHKVKTLKKQANNHTNIKINHLNLIKNGIDFIKKGNVSKVVLSRKEEVDFSDLSLSEIFQNLLHNYTLAFVYIWFHPKVGLWMGASPETLLSVNNYDFKTMALAGTQRYQGSINVEWKTKEIEEQRFVTDFIVDQLKYFGLKISKTFSKKAGSLLHICTELSGRIHSKDQLKFIIDQLHPTPAVCGLPKDTAKQYILKNENYNREFYTGYLGEMNIKDTTNLFVNLRCMKIENQRANIYIGGGITADSIPESEWEETVAKSETIKSILKV